MKLSPLERKIEKLVELPIHEMGYELVTVKLEDNGKSPSLLIMVEEPESGRLSIDDCAKISRSLTTLLDVEDPINGPYSLQVSSPGMDRPLVKREDFKRFSGKQVKLETVMAIENQKRFKGILEAYLEDDDCIRIKTDEKTQDIEFDNIKKANLVITDEMLRKDLNRNKNQVNA